MLKLREMPPVKECSNSGLALSHCVPEKDDKQRAAFFKAVTAIPVDDVYLRAFARWQDVLKERGALLSTGILGGPLAVGLGNESPYEAGLTLHRIYGTPVIPGSAIKGACLRAIRELSEEDRTNAQALFGNTDSPGSAIFHDAWFDPGWQNDAKPIATPLSVDTVTVHHPKYYSSRGACFPTDFDDPDPVPFVSVRPGTRFLFAIEIPGVDDAWRRFVEDMLDHALTRTGLGGKTNAGYGWFKAVERQRPLSLEELFAKLLPRIEKIAQPSHIGQAVNILEDTDTPELKRMVAITLKKRFLEKKWWKTGTEDKPWRKAIEEALR